MKANYVHKDSKTINDEIYSYKIKVPLINQDELQRIDGYYNEIVDEIAKQIVKEKNMIVSQRVMMNLRKENQKYEDILNKIKEFLDNHDKNAVKLYYKYNNKYLSSEIKEDIRDVLKEVK